MALPAAVGGLAAGAVPLPVDAAPVPNCNAGGGTAASGEGGTPPGDLSNSGLAEKKLNAAVLLPLLPVAAAVAGVSPVTGLRPPNKPLGLAAGVVAAVGVTLGAAAAAGEKLSLPGSRLAAGVLKPCCCALGSPGCGWPGKLKAAAGVANVAAAGGVTAAAADICKGEGGRGGDITETPESWRCCCLLAELLLWPDGRGVATVVRTRDLRPLPPVDFLALSLSSAANFCHAELLVAVLLLERTSRC